jgi:hypothetical protein
MRFVISNGKRTVVSNASGSTSSDRIETNLNLAFILAQPLFSGEKAGCRFKLTVQA